MLRVRELDRSTPFYELLGFRKVGQIGNMMAFFTATGANHHDLALQAVGRDAPSPGPNAVGLYHVAIRLPSDESVRAAFRVLADAGAEIVGASDPGVSHSLYIKDPDGIELELYADVPGWKEHGDEVATSRPWDPRELEASPGAGETVSGSRASQNSRWRTSTSRIDASLPR